MGGEREERRKSNGGKELLQWLTGVDSSYCDISGPLVRAVHQTVSWKWQGAMGKFKKKAYFY